MIYYENESIDPCYNLAMEEACLNQAGSEPILLLWRNEPTVVVGRYQNTAGEINESFVEEHHVHVVRRMTGGGAVYHDLGNLNYSILVRDYRSQIDFELFTRPVLAVLESLGIAAELSGRNDLVIDGRKCSGNAQYRAKGCVLHHGTLLFDSNLNDMASALCVDPQKFWSKAVSSVRSRVTNIKDHLTGKMAVKDVMEFRDLILDRISGFGAISREEPDELLNRKAKQLRETKYGTWDWNWGKSPTSDYCYSRRFEWGLLEFHLRVEDGIIVDGEVRGDFFALRDPNEFINCLRGLPPSDAGITEAIRNSGKDYFAGMS